MYYFHIFNQHLTSNMSYKCIIQLNILHILQWDNLTLATVSILLFKTKRCSVLLQVFTQIYLVVCVLAILQTCLHYMLQADNWFKANPGSESRCRRWALLKPFGDEDDQCKRLVSESFSVLGNFFTIFWLFIICFYPYLRKELKGFVFIRYVR